MMNSLSDSVILKLLKKNDIKIIRLLAVWHDAMKKNYKYLRKNGHRPGGLMAVFAWLLRVLAHNWSA